MTSFHWIHWAVWLKLSGNTGYWMRANSYFPVLFMTKMSMRQSPSWRQHWLWEWMKMRSVFSAHPKILRWKHLIIQKKLERRIPWYLSQMLYIGARDVPFRKSRAITNTFSHEPYGEIRSKKWNERLVSGIIEHCYDGICHAWDWGVGLCQAVLQGGEEVRGEISNRWSVIGDQ